MALPRVRIQFLNGALGQVEASEDGVVGVLTTGVAVSTTFLLLTSYKLTKFDDLTTLGITQANNPGIWKLMTELYNQNPNGAEVWLKAFADTVTLTNMATRTYTSGVQELLQTANGRIRTLIIHRTPNVGYTPTITAGLDSEVITAIAAAQITAAWATDTLKAPIFVAIAGIYYSGVDSALTAINIGTNNRVCVMVGDTVSGNGCAIGLLAGKLAAVPVQRNIGRVKDGAVLGVTLAYYAATKLESNDVTGVHDKGYITLRTHVGRSGYFFVDGPLAALPTDDYSQITARRTVDKAFRIAYTTLVNEMLDEVSVTDKGKISVAYAKSIENKVENAIINSMTANGELGNDPGDQNDTGVSCWINTDQNIVATGQVNVTLKVKPYGYARFIEVSLGFKTLTA